MSEATDTLVAAFERACAEQGDRVAVITGGVELTFRELRTNAEPWARALAALRVEKGDRVGVLLPNVIEWLYLDYAAGCLGAVIVPVNGRYRPAELEKFLDAADLRVLFAHDEFLTNDYLERLAEVLPEIASAEPGTWRAAKSPSLEHVVAMGTRKLRGMMPREKFLAGTATVDAKEVAARARRVGPRDPGWIFYTSGSTGEPKGVVAPQDSVVNLRAYWRAQGRTADDRMLCPMPLYYIGGHFVSFLTPLLSGASVVLGQTFDVDEIVSLLQAHDVTFFGNVPPTFTQIMHHPALEGRDLSSVRAGFVAGSAFSLPQLEAWSKRLGIPRFMGGFGMTETLGGASCTSPDDPLEVAGTTVGRPIEGFEFEIRHPETRARMPVGEPGELWVRGRIMLGYHGMSAADYAEYVTPDGWFRTGDLLVERADGRYSYVARLKDLIKVRGENVSAPQVEADLVRHSDVVEAAVVGVPDEVRGEAVVAYVQRQAGSTLTKDALRAWCKELMAPHKVPQHFVWIDRAEAWPRLPSAKIAKATLRATFKPDSRDGS
ncbi:MAG: class I adenylate-forming enzyme family protein [Candidatus Binatia bacterium]